MNAHIQAPARGTEKERIAELMDDVDEMLGGVALQAGLAQVYAETRDIDGAAYALRKMMAHVRAAIGSFNDAVAIKEGRIQ